MPHRKRVLHMDDDPMLRQLVARLLSPHVVVGAADGEAGLQRWREEAFDLVVCDMMMPRMNGQEVHRQLSMLSPAAAARMLFLTSGTPAREGQEFLATMGERVLWKPIDATLLRARVTAALRPVPQP